MKSSFAEDIYNTLCGTIEEGKVPGVEDLFAEGMPCARLYGEMWDAYERILEQLGKTDEDEDVETIINALLSICEEVGIRMYHYGAKFGERE